MLRLRDIFLRKLALIFLVLFVVLGASLYVWIKDIYIEETKKDLLHNIDILTVNIQNMKDIDSYVHAVKAKTGIRVTIIDPLGRVIAESNRDKVTMDNHRFREEIIAAKEDAYGYAIRHSDTLNKELLYVAKSTTVAKQPCFIRMARDIDEIIGAFTTVSIKTALLFLLFALFAYRMILGIGSDIQHETEKILYFLDEMGSKEKDRQIDSRYSVEFKKITMLLTETSRKLAKRRKQKNKYTARLKLANRQKDEIISAISHEFKNPIAVISGYSQTLIEDKEIKPAITDKFLEKIHSNAHKLSELIDRLRLSIRLDEKREHLKPAPCDFSQHITNTIETLRISYPDREIRYHTDSIPPLECDPALMEIAISNLIENALKYSKEAPVTVTLSSEGVKVTDEGIGIAKEEITKITKKFYRVSGNSWNNSMGIGLSLVSTIVAMHGFTLHIDSQVGKGSTFAIIFSS